jgi:malonyl-CoA/methylmalonyl-CoA synthetase
LQVSLEDPALFIYTSGTTGKPKGVVHTHRSFTAQVTDLVKAWEWTADDHILHFLPLHHIHGKSPLHALIGHCAPFRPGPSLTLLLPCPGIQNKLNSALYAGATVEFMRFNSPKLFDRLSSATDPAPSLFMGVPTVYAKMLEEARTRKGGTTDEQLQGSVSALSGMRLHVCGSAALPSTVMAGWKDLTSHTLLERYGMSELGMALGNPYKGDRHEGHVGVPFDSVEVRIFNPETGDEVPEGAGSGELQVRACDASGRR